MLRWILFALFPILLLACANERESASKTASTQAPPSLNPNGDSELALLMRQMENHWKEVKKHLAAGEDSFRSPDFSDLLTATPTDPDMKSPEFEAFAKAYLNSIEDWANAPKDRKATGYNSIIDNCIACHENSCHGPIPRIKKLRLKAKN